jgi:AraC family ethanolamine operon transcriptional activator
MQLPVAYNTVEVVNIKNPQTRLFFVIIGMSESPANPILLHRSFDDFDELAVMARHWDLDLRQLGRGRFDGELLQAVAGTTLFTEARFGRTLEQRGTSPSGLRTMAITAQPGVRFKWRRKTITDSDILIFPRSGELESISHSDFHVYIISIPEAQLQEIAEVAGVPDVLALLAAETVTCLPSRLRRLRRALRDLAWAAKGNASLLADANVLREIEYEVPRLFVEAMRRSPSPPKSLTSQQRDLAIKRAESFIAQNTDEPLTVRDVCGAAAVSERTLQYAFMDYFGMTPKTYLRAVRLNGARRDLKYSEPGIKINEIANRWGFWHMSQFAADYRKQFGELPSRTRQNSVGRL